MTDIAIAFNGGVNVLAFEAGVAKGDIAHDDGLKSAVLYSLFTDRQANDDDEIPDGSTDRRGHWADSILGESNGSRLWLLRREKQTQKTLNRAIAYAKEALQWLIDDGHAVKVTVAAEWASLGLLALHIIIDLADGERFDQVFEKSLG
ncbi:MAG: phage GP46 family protein [Gammaproteobacteria bacterium]|nr:phage GP46 family protein [Gammaproteobacteria bacterium]